MRHESRTRRTRSRLVLLFTAALIVLHLAAFAAAAATLPARGTSATFQWSPPQGAAVIGYEVFVSRDGGAFRRIPSLYTAAPRVTVSGSYGESVRIVVRAVASGMVSGFSAESDRVVFVPDLPEDPVPAREGVATRHDFNGDGKDDLLWFDPDAGAYVLWLMWGHVLLDETVLPDGPPGHSLATTGDFDGNGVADLFWFDPAKGTSRVWLLRDGGPPNEIGLPAASPGWRVAACGDVNGDGHADLVWHNADLSANVVWLIRDGAYTLQLWLPASSRGWSPVTLADFDADGDQDLLWRSPGTGGNAVWLLEEGLYQRQLSLPVAAGAWRLGAAPDLDGDGRSEILWTVEPGEAVAWKIDARDLVLQEPMQRPDAASALIGARDLDGDGRADLIWQGPDDGSIVAWLMHGTTPRSTGLLPQPPPGWTQPGN